MACHGQVVLRQQIFPVTEEIADFQLLGRLNGIQQSQIRTSPVINEIPKIAALASPKSDRCLILTGLDRATVESGTVVGIININQFPVCVIIRFEANFSE